jgi:hypothetical protein
MRCAKAYLAAFRHAQDKNYDYVLIIEDDFNFKLAPVQYNYIINKFLIEVPRKDWDVVFLAHRAPQVQETKYPYLDRVTKSLTGGAFLLNKTYYNTMIEIAKISLNNLKQSGEQKNAIDEIWKSYQLKDRWFAFNPPLGQGGQSLCSLTDDDILNITPVSRASTLTTPVLRVSTLTTPVSRASSTESQDVYYLAQLDEYRKKSQAIYNSSKTQWTALEDRGSENRIKDELPVPTRFDENNSQLKKALEDISRGSYKETTEIPIMKIPTVTLHPNEKCWKYYQLQSKS